MNNYLTPEQFGAIGDGRVDDTSALQAWANELVKTHGVGYLQKKYKTSKPIVFASWVESTQRYGQISVTIFGDATMSDNHSKSQIIASHKDGPILAFHLAKGGGVYGVGLKGAYLPPKISRQLLYKSDLSSYGDPTCRDTRYSPYCGIVIDPFSSTPPSDGGYPTLQEWYRGPATRSGSTGFTIKNVTISNVTIGIITSPNGYTQNAENLLYEDTRFADCKICFAGCQAQEKNNVIRRFQVWGTTHTVLVFNRYGIGQPGNYWVENGNLAGTVVHLINRSSSGWGKMSIRDTFAESISSIGYWYGGSGDLLDNCLLNMEYTENLGYLPSTTLMGKMVRIQNCQIRYYGRTTQPLLFPGNENGGGNTFYVPSIFKRYEWETWETGYKILKNIFYYTSDIVVDHTLNLKLKDINTAAQLIIGDHVVFMRAGNWEFFGQGKISKIEGYIVTVSYISPGVQDMTGINVGVYKKI